MKVYIVEVETGSSYEGNAMLFDSVWSSYEAAESYAKERYGKQNWSYQINDHTLDVGG